MVNDAPRRSPGPERSGPGSLRAHPPRHDDGGEAARHPLAHRVPLLLVPLPARVEMVEVQDRVEHHRVAALASRRARPGSARRPGRAPCRAARRRRPAAARSRSRPRAGPTRAGPSRRRSAGSTRGRCFTGITLIPLRSCSSVTGGACQGSTLGSTGGASTRPRPAARRDRRSCRGPSAARRLAAEPRRRVRRACCSTDEDQPVRQVDRQVLVVAVGDRARAGPRTSSARRCPAPSAAGSAGSRRPASGRR